jgi:hypothetical protein
MAQAASQSILEFLDRLRLIACRFEVGYEPEVGHVNLVEMDSKYIATVCL